MFPHQLTGEAAQGPGSTGADATLLLQAERMASYALLAETAKALETGQVVKSRKMVGDAGIEPATPPV